ncbi:hypothetical protein NEOLEDRAFT_781280 [Neolentinus lepideus HHB14362 ss-1]|uniref:HAT C-terminal dimerisation domain-containing protein n=1 Tax=Neolentinus lepideus HHB14362 ss-1 TaxID=1314782 RepID=A0A165UWN7_9AGAM|nr:hypothetical protein NEOLEDRAFT_781280 [Neolentinus lepideus HHB14362 ss-1]
MEVFLDKLVRYVIASGQSLDLVEEPEFRDLLLFVGRSLADIDLPDRQKLSQLIEAKYQEQQNGIMRDLKDVTGRVSLSVELVQDTGAPPRLAITAHYCANTEDGTMGLRSRVIAFHAIPEHPVGEADPAIIANVIHNTLSTFNLHEKIGVVTLGDALFDGRLRAELDKLLIHAGYQAADYLRNFLPIINDAMESGLEVLTSASPSISGIAVHQSSELSQALLENKRYLEALGRNPISRAHNLVAAIAESPDRLTVLLRSEDDGETVSADLLQEDGRWSSKYLMIDRLMALQPVISRLLKDEEQTDIAHYALDDAESDVLSDIKEFLRCAFAVHEMVGEEKLPLAVMAVPLYEQLLTVLKEFQQSLPEINSAISITVTKLEEALTECRKSEAYALSIILNPTAKLKWIEDNWSVEERDKAKTLILHRMTEQHHKLKAQSGHDEAGSSTQSQPKETTKGLSALNRLLGARRIPHKSGRASSGAEGSLVAEDLSDQNAELKQVEAELQRYIEAGVLESGDEYNHFDIFRYWKVREWGYPLLYRVALDVLPVQASVFSSPGFLRSTRSGRAGSRATGPALDEMIMVLKYGHDPDKLNFTHGWIAKEDELTVSDNTVL